ncbi:protein of unknown function [Catalinimonas alkaloidigena]|uniref:Uncharacterized protein n=1 Tax=Catalinimonas alkaloidigena TaxID=1075417 RepID=A0A1G9GDQ5_9BACT|nr:nucleoside hydrolase-like domain-containing protein [Catalinimonas alkaloidigena]SDK98826.1 protein of unknown function [Catalinimonas alkaloidigena]
MLICIPLVRHRWIGFVAAGAMLLCLTQCTTPAPDQTTDTAKPRILISTDIGGTDPDDFQSMIHFLMYADRFQTEGLLSSPYGPGRKEAILAMIDLYAQDLPRLQAHADGFPAPDSLRSVTKQGAVDAAPYPGWSVPTEGSEWIVRCARKTSDQPLWVLVWGGLEDLAQAVHDAPDIKEHIRVYWIGGPNKKWSVNSYAYLAEHHPDLWFIEANATYRGWFMDEGAPTELSNDGYYDHAIRARGHLGRNFKQHYGGSVKMGDTPSLAYVMHGDPHDPTGESWGGSFTPITHSARRIFDRPSTERDTVPVYATLEWRFPGPDLPVPPDSACFTLEVNQQTWPGYALGGGQYAVRYSSKQEETSTYRISSNLPGFPTQTGAYVSQNPWPGAVHAQDYPLGNQWYSDRTEPEAFMAKQQGARTVAQWRTEFLEDWATRWQWLADAPEE